jgi:3-demethoxyubiquinol 3-hydroxylase
LNSNSAQLTVFFDGGCPLCKREISVYQKASTGQPVEWLDVNQEANLPLGLTHERALAELHVLRRSADGTETLEKGAKAFTTLWRHVPGWRWLGYLGSFPIVLSLLEYSYQGFLKIRPQLQKLVRALEPAVSQSPPFMVADLRSDHAGETGAVWIYRGILLIARDARLVAFAQHHLDTEKKHLLLMESILPWRQRSRLLIFWRLAGFLTGFLPTIFGSRTVYLTIGAVETFVDKHYQEQIEKLECLDYPGLLLSLKSCQFEEQNHRDEAFLLCGVQTINSWQRLWLKLVSQGSALAVKLAKSI